MAEPIKVAGVQMDVTLARPELNLRRMNDFLAQTHRQGAVLTVFPECALAGYCFETREEALPLAEPVPGPSTQTLTEICRRLGVYVVFGLLELDSSTDPPRLFNACALVGPEGVIGNYRKIHLPYLGVDRFTTPGDRPFKVHRAGGLRVGMNICYDGGFPESARVMALAGADLIVLPTNWPPGAECTADYIINARALENHVYYLAVDRVGVERGFEFIGKSRFCEPYGRVIADAPHTSETVLYGQIDVDLPRNKHLVRVPKLHEIDRFADRRPEMYGLITAPVDRADFRDELRKQGSGGRVQEVV
jgi:predicted amidohydrolase